MNQKVNYVVIGLLVLVVLAFAGREFMGRGNGNKSNVEPKRAGSLIVAMNEEGASSEQTAFMKDMLLCVANYIDVDGERDNPLLDETGDIVSTFTKDDEAALLNAVPQFASLNKSWSFKTDFPMSTKVFVSKLKEVVGLESVELTKEKRKEIANALRNLVNE